MSVSINFLRSISPEIACETLDDGREIEVLDWRPDRAIWSATAAGTLP